MTNAQLAARHQAALIGNYGKLPAALIRGQGSQLWDADGKEYIDLFAGLGGTILGHCHPALVKAITDQAHTVWAVGNQFYTEPQIRLAEHLKEKAFDGRTFFCHSGAEAAEAAIKLARISARTITGQDRFKIISFHKGFHGRTLGALSATPGKYQDGFTPLTPGFAHATYNDLASVTALVDAQTAGIIIEPIQGEGGVNMPDPAFLPALRKLCDENKIALIFDEVWTGVGRTGRYFGHHHFGVTPDIMTMGKALGGGIPVGGIHARPEFAKYFVPGTHGCTLGGNPLCAAVGAAIFDALVKDNLLAHANAMSDVAQSAIRGFKNAARVKDVRGKGLMLGIELNAADGTPALNAALARGLIINVTRSNVIRLCPAVTIDRATLERGLAILDEALAALS